MRWPKNFDRSGDFHLAHGLSQALRRLGYTTTLQAISHWDQDVGQHVDLVMRGWQEFVPNKDRPALYWLLYGDVLTEREARDGRYFFVASAPFHKVLSPQYGSDRVGLLLQAFDRDRMKPSVAVRDAPLCFVGRGRGRRLRPIVRYALEAGYAPQIWGERWEATDAAMYLQAPALANTAVTQVYGRALGVMNDHMTAMVESQVPSNRIFDSLACGAPVISDDPGWLPDDIRPFVHIVGDGPSFASAVDAICAENQSRRDARLEFAHAMRGRHDLDARAKTISDTIQAIL